MDLTGTISDEVDLASESEANAFLLGAAHDATFSERHNTTQERFLRLIRFWHVRKHELIELRLGQLNVSGWVEAMRSTDRSGRRKPG